MPNTYNDTFFWEGRILFLEEQFLTPKKCIIGATWEFSILLKCLWFHRLLVVRSLKWNEKFFSVVVFKKYCVLKCRWFIFKCTTQWVTIFEGHTPGIVIPNIDSTPWLVQYILVAYLLYTSWFVPRGPPPRVAPPRSLSPLVTTHSRSASVILCLSCCVR